MDLRVSLKSLLTTSSLSSWLFREDIVDDLIVHEQERKLHLSSVIVAMGPKPAVRFCTSTCSRVILTGRLNRTAWHVVWLMWFAIINAHAVHCMDERSTAIIVIAGRSGGVLSHFGGELNEYELTICSR